MALDVYCGPANAGKTGLVYARLRERCSSGGTAALLLPSVPDVARAIDELAPSAPIGLQVTTLDAFLARAWQSVGDGRRIVRPVQRLAILEGVLRTARLGSLGPSAQTPGFLRTLARLVQETAGRDPSGFDISHATPGMAHDLRVVLAAYEQALDEAGLVEEREAQRVVTAHIGGVVLPELVVAHRFTTFTRTQEEFLVAASRVSEVAVTLTFSPTVPATAAAGDLVARFAKAGRVHTCVADRAYSASPELQRIERALGGVAADGGGVAAEGAVVLSEAQGESAEAARVVREVQDALADGFAPGSIAVAFKDPSPRLRALRAAFADAEIAVAWDIQVPFTQTGLGRALLMLLAVCGGTGGRAEVLDLLRSPYSPLDADSVDVIDARLRRARIRDAAGAKRVAAASDERARRFFRRGEALCKGPLDSEALVRWHRFVAAMLGSARPGAPVLDLDGLLDAAAQRAFLEALEGLAETKAGSATSVAAALREAVVTVAPAEERDVVQVMPLARLRGRRFACVIIGGLVAGEFPRSAREDVLAAPDMAAAVASLGLEVERQQSVADERLLFYQAVTRASRRLVLSRQTHDDEGRERSPSLFWEELLDLYRDPATGAWHAGEPPRRFLGLDGFALEPDGPNTLRRRLRAAAAGAVPDEETGPDACRLEYARLRTRARPTIVGTEAAEALARRTVFSVSDIELYLQCPFRWYVERTLRPEALDADVDAATTGRLVHGALKRFYDEFVASTGESRVTEATLGRAVEILTAVVSAELEGLGDVNLVERVSLRQAMRGVERLVRSDAVFLPGMSPAYREWSFGLEEGDEGEPIGSFVVRGRIDRLDTDGTRLVVTDYKLGRVDSTRGQAAFEREGLVQLPLYALVAHRRLGLEIAGGVYRGVKDGQARGFVREDLAREGFIGTDRVTDAQIDELVEAAVARAEVAVAGMRAGEIAARPRKSRCPDYCTARPFCDLAGGSDG